MELTTQPPCDQPEVDLGGGVERKRVTRYKCPLCGLVYKGRSDAERCLAIGKAEREFAELACAMEKEHGMVVLRSENGMIMSISSLSLTPFMLSKGQKCGRNLIVHCVDHNNYWTGEMLFGKKLELVSLQYAMQRGWSPCFAGYFEDHAPAEQLDLYERLLGQLEEGELPLIDQSWAKR